MNSVAVAAQESNNHQQNHISNPYQDMAADQGESFSPTTEEKDTPAFEQAVKRNNLEQMDDEDDNE